ncbi:MAG TPA: hypothetical protein VFY92_07705 [Hyphomicrobiaceae bacterium]|nr:hypothetical protein [Hyphomicrobiaceae bacterium]
MLNARHSFTLIWKRLVAALSLVAAAALAPAAPAAGVAGAGGMGSRAGSSSAAVANAASALVATAVSLAEGQQALSTGASDDGAKAKACGLAARPEGAWQLPRVASAPLRAGVGCRQTHAARAGLTRAPPCA